MTAVDDDAGRIDHEGYVPEIWAGLWLSALYFMQQGPSIAGLSDYVEDVLALALFAGATICLFGVILGTKWFMPSLGHTAAHITQLCGLPLIIGAMGMYTWGYGTNNDNLLVTVLGGGLGLCIEIGCVRMFVDLVRILTREETAEIDEEDYYDDET